MNEEQKPRDLKVRTREFALRIIRLYSSLPKTTEAQVLGNQKLRSGTSVGAHYREGTRARSDAQFISKIGGGLQELEETIYWMELLAQSGTVDESRLQPLMQEADELTAILVTCAKNARNRKPSFHPSSLRLHPFISPVATWLGSGVVGRLHPFA